MKKMMSASMALLVMDEPHVGPDGLHAVLDVLHRGVGQLGDGLLDLERLRLLRRLRELVEVGLHVELLVAPLPEQLDDGFGEPGRRMALVAWVWVTLGAFTVHSVPPLNSMPRFSPPRRMMEMIPATMMTVEMVNHVLRRPTKSKRVSPR